MQGDILLAVVTIVIFVITVFFSLIGYFLMQKDTKQGRDIDMLFAIHKEDSERLEAHKLETAGNYHKKPEIERMMAENRSYLNEKFDYMEKLIVAVSGHRSGQ